MIITIMLMQSFIVLVILDQTDGVSCRVVSSRIYFLLPVIFFYSYCPVELSVCIDAAGNPIDER